MALLKGLGPRASPLKMLLRGHEEGTQESTDGAEDLEFHGVSVRRRSVHVVAEGWAVRNATF